MSSILNGAVSAGSTLSETFHNISIVAPQLNLLEKLWALYYIQIGNDIFATGLFIFVYHEFMYFGRCIPFLICDMIPSMRKYKIQDEKAPNYKEQIECMKAVLLSHFMVEAVPIWGFHPLCYYLGIKYDVPFPSLSTMAYQIAIFFVLEDSWHYWFHRGLHIGSFYKYIHKQHHRYAAPFGFAAEYAHPIEVALLGFGTIGIPVIFAALSGNLHMVTVVIWVGLRLFQAVDAHSGYEFPWSLHHILPFWAGADHHDDHHRFFLGNYASSFRWWDHVLATNPKSKRKPKVIDGENKKTR